MLCAEMWVRQYPDWPGVAMGELVITASNPAVPDMVAVVPDGLTLAWGTARCVATLPAAGDTIADGQVRASRLVVVWPDRVADWATVAAVLPPAGVCAMGLDRPWPAGRPVADPQPLAWTQRWLPAVEASLGGWASSGLGPAMDSGTTGAQEDQVFVGGELGAVPAGLGAEVVRYLAALGQLRQPHHHLEADGTQLALTGHPGLTLWYSRPHWHEGVSPDRLGKPRGLSSAESHGWVGPDDQHWLHNTMSVAARATGSPALQWGLSAFARNLIYEFDEYPGALRSVGWRYLSYWWLAKGLEDRALAGHVIADGRAFAAVVKRDWTPRPWWWVESTSPQDTRLTGRDRVTMVWQHGLATYGMDLFGELAGQDDLRVLAHRGAVAALQAWTWTGRRWQGWGYVGTTGGVFGPLVEGDGAHYGAGVESWMTLTIATVLRHEPGHERALAIKAQLIRERAQGGRWIPPEWGP
jgi:hypothetical protein